jgi:Zn-dependent protease
LLPIGGLARLDRLPEEPAEELMLLQGSCQCFISNNNWFFITFPENAEVLAAQLSSGVNANNFSSFFIVNIVLAVFNLIPAFPWMEGVRALLSFKLKRHSNQNCGKNRSIYSWIYFFRLYPFLIFIGLFVIVAAQMETQHAASKFILKGFKVRDILMKQYQY